MLNAFLLATFVYLLIGGFLGLIVGLKVQSNQLDQFIDRIMDSLSSKYLIPLSQESSVRTTIEVTFRITFAVFLMITWGWLVLTSQLSYEISIPWKKLFKRR